MMGGVITYTIWRIGFNFNKEVSSLACLFCFIALYVIYEIRDAKSEILSEMRREKK